MVYSMTSEEEDQLERYSKRPQVSPSRAMSVYIVKDENQALETRGRLKGGRKAYDTGASPEGGERAVF
jgi:hypothetical protein